MGIFAKGRLLMSALLMSSALACATAQADEPVKIVAAENMYGKIAEAVGGNLVTVTSIISNPNEDPHLFEARPETAAALKTRKSSSRTASAMMAGWRSCWPPMPPGALM